MACLGHHWQLHTGDEETDGRQWNTGTVLSLPQLPPVGEIWELTNQPHITARKTRNKCGTLASSRKTTKGEPQGSTWHSQRRVKDAESTWWPSTPYSRMGTNHRKPKKPCHLPTRPGTQCPGTDSKSCQVRQGLPQWRFKHLFYNNKGITNIRH